MLEIIVVAIISRRDRLRCKSDSAYSYTFHHSVVCLSVVCRIYAPCLNRLTDWDAFASYTCEVQWQEVGYRSMRIVTNEELRERATAISLFAQLL